MKKREKEKSAERDIEIERRGKERDNRQETEHI